MIRLQRTPLFERTVRTIVINNPKARTLITVALKRMKKNPFAPQLDTKRVYTKRHKLRWGSMVKDDMRIIWDFADAKQTRIILLTIGGNKEPLNVYKEKKDFSLI